jgi:hypothetical protein
VIPQLVKSCVLCTIKIKVIIVWDFFHSPTPLRQTRVDRFFTSFRINQNNRHSPTQHGDLTSPITVKLHANVYYKYKRHNLLRSFYTILAVIVPIFKYSCFHRYNLEPDVQVETLPARMKVLLLNIPGDCFLLSFVLH